MSVVSLHDLTSALDDTESPRKIVDRHYMSMALPEGVSPDFYNVKSKEELRTLQQVQEQAMVPEAAEITPGIFIGNKKAAQNTAFLKSKGITHLLNVALDSTDPSKFYQVPVDQDKLEGIKYASSPMTDISQKDGPNLCEVYTQKSKMIHQFKTQESGRVLVNCFAGVNRSSTTVAAYLVLHQNMPILDALTLIKGKRDVRPNKDNLVTLATLHNHTLAGITNIDEARPKDIDVVEWKPSILAWALSKINIVI